jgi:hypothetical protein
VSAGLRGHAEVLTALANAPRRDVGSTRAIYSYPAKFQARLPAELIARFSRPGDLVVDPYCGGGTTGLEAYLLGRPFAGVDLSPFACLVARAKTTRLAAAAVEQALAAVLASRERRDGLLDEGDAACLGAPIADEIARLAGGIAGVGSSGVGDLLTLALINAVKLAGRRDFTAPSIVPLFQRKALQAARAVAALPDREPRPQIACRSNHSLELSAGSARLVVTSPPYKDLDVEYALLQLQRPALGKSKRSKIVWRLLGAPPISKKALCGGAGGTYWRHLAPSLAEIRRVLAVRSYAFFWTGFKTDEDRRAFEQHLGAAAMPVALAIPVTLGRDRVASSRSTHHGRPTGMLARDWLFGCVAA